MTKEERTAKLKEYRSLTLKQFVEEIRGDREQVEWFKAIADTLITVNVYPQVPVVDAAGNPVLTKEKKRQKMKADKTAEPIGKETIRIPFVKIKAAWIAKFHPEVYEKEKDTFTLDDALALLG